MSGHKIYEAITKVMADVESIGKNKKNTFQGYVFRGIDDMYNAIHPALVKNGVFCCPQVVKAESFEIRKTKGNEEQINFRVLLTVNHKFYAHDGSFIEVITLGEGIDTSDKASNKAMSAAMKYAFIELLSIPTEDIADSDADSPMMDERQRGTAHAPKPQQSQTVAPLKQQEDTAPCEMCGANLAKGQWGYYCPNYKNGKGHTQKVTNLDQYKRDLKWKKENQDIPT